MFLQVCLAVAVLLSSVMFISCLLTLFDSLHRSKACDTHNLAVCQPGQFAILLSDARWCSIMIQHFLHDLRLWVRRCSKTVAS